LIAPKTDNHAFAAAWRQAGKRIDVDLMGHDDQRAWAVPCSKQFLGTLGSRGFLGRIGEERIENRLSPNQAGERECGGFLCPAPLGRENKADGNLLRPKPIAHSTCLLTPVGVEIPLGAAIGDAEARRIAASGRMSVAKQDDSTVAKCGPRNLLARGRRRHAG
jgi:hypothetical protein